MQKLYSEHWASWYDWDNDTPVHFQNQVCNSQSFFWFRSTLFQSFYHLAFTKPVPRCLYMLVFACVKPSLH